MKILLVYIQHMYKTSHVFCCSIFGGMHLTIVCTNHLELN